MSWITRSALRAGLAAGIALALLGLTAQAASADGENVKYYTVLTSYNGAPENVTEIATRFLGSGSRSAEVFNLNTGRAQPDGSALTDGTKLHPGWMLILPWDAVGAGVQYGVLPDKTPTTAVTPTTAPKSSPTPSSPSKAAPAPSPSKTKSSKGSKGSSTAPHCATASASSTKSDWATLRLAPDQAWTTSKGKGQLVAVVDSGADGSLPQLTGHLSQGMDIVGGTGRGDTDCLGTGTAMAGLISAQQSSGGAPTGIAPDATVMPVRVIDKGTKAKPADCASAITAAVAAGATVVALGSYVDTTNAAVAKAINDAVAHDVVVVFGAALNSEPVNPAAAIGDQGVLRVGGIGLDQQAAAGYVAGGVDVVAPGVNINTLGITGAGSTARSGTQYAVAFVAGEAALVRAAFPDLSAQQVAHRVEATAENIGGGSVPNGAFGYGLISLSTAVTKALPEETQSVAPVAGKAGSSSAPSGRTALLVIVTLVALAAAILLIFRIRRLMLIDPEEDELPEAIDEAQPQKTGTPAA